MGSSLINTALGIGPTINAFADLNIGPYRPARWNDPAQVMITVPQANQTSSTNDPSVFSLNSVGQTSYVFDAVLLLEHEQSLVKTQHPVQNGSNISSHAYLMPAHLVMYVGMSDAMAAYATGFNPSQPPYITPFSGNPSKSVSAYQQMLAIQAARQPLTITTRLRTYTNMIITRIAPHEDSRTITGLKMRIEFEQIFTASISTTDASARPQDTGSTGLGGQNVQPPSAATTSQFNIEDGFKILFGGQAETAPINVPGAGTWSSVNVNSLQKVP